jgi:hypothetical protein
MARDAALMFRPPDHAFSPLTSDANSSAACRRLPGMTWAYTCNVMVATADHRYQMGIYPLSSLSCASPSTSTLPPRARFRKLITAEAIATGAPVPSRSTTT